MVGRPLSCDELTYGCTRLEYARLCVEVDAVLLFVHSFDINSPLSTTPITVTVEYEWKPPRCEKCKVFSHSCVVLVTDTVKATADPTTTAPQTEPSQHLPVAVYTVPSTKDALHLEPANTLINHEIASTKPSTSTKTAQQPELTLLKTITPPNPSTNAKTAPTLIKPVEQAHLTSHPTPKPHFFVPLLEPAIPTNIEDCDSSQDSGNELLGLQNHHFNGLHATLCLESKMDSIRTSSATSLAAHEVSAKASTSSVHPTNNHIHSPPPTQTTVKKKKGLRKKKKARDL